MQAVSTQSIRGWFSIAMLVVLVSSVLVWLFQRNPIPRVVRIATGEPGGLYHRLGDIIAPTLKSGIHRTIEVESTRGSEENRELLISHKAELAIIQGGATSFENLSIITPLFPEYLFIIVRKGSGIESVADLTGHTVSLGTVGSGNRTSAIQLLQYYMLDPSDLDDTDHYFIDLLTESSLDAAIVTAGLENPDLKKLMASHQFQLLPVRSSTAIDLTHPFLRAAEIPRGIFSKRPAVPSEPIPTLATTAYLVAEPETSPKLVSAVLKAVHEESLRLSVPTLISRKDAPDWTKIGMHPTAHHYFYPTDEVGEFANVLESLAATKELVFALGAGIYLLWIRWRKLKEAETSRLIRQQKDRLDGFLTQTLSIEEKILETKDVRLLRTLLNRVSRIKLKALQELTEEELRGDQTFAIFLEQCDSLIHQIQLQLIARNTAST